MSPALEQRRNAAGPAHHGSIKSNSKGECMQRYNNHPIYGIGIRGLENKWNCRGLIFDSEDQVTEIQRLECPELTFVTKRKAEDYGLELCKKWINEQSIESSSRKDSTSAKAGAVAL